MKPRGWRGLVFACLVLPGALGLPACAQSALEQTAPPHHDDSGFRNLHVDQVTPGFGAFLRWRWQAWRRNLPPPPRVPTPVQPAKLHLLHADAADPQSPPRVTWIGHASALVQAGGLRVLTDPIFSQRASPFSWLGPQRAQPPGVALHDLPPIDAVLISHNHYDHLDRDSLVRLYQRGIEKAHPTTFLVPLGLKALLQEWGIAGVQELDWWQTATLGVTQFHLTPVQHWSARGLFDRHHTLWGGWAVLSPDLHWFYAGDTGYSPDFAMIRTRFADQQTPVLGGGFDLALLPIGAYEPRWFMQGQHIDPAQAVQVHQDLGAKRSLGVHWGTFELTDEPLDQAPRDLAAARAAAQLPGDAFFVLDIGETRVLAPRNAAPASMRLVR